MLASVDDVTAKVVVVMSAPVVGAAGVSVVLPCVDDVTASVAVVVAVSQWCCLVSMTPARMPPLHSAALT